MIKKTFRIDGMHCSSCAMLIEGELEDRGACKACCSFAKQSVEVEFNPEELSEEQISDALAAVGYKVLL